jgi:hypothetical protein
VAPEQKPWEFLPIHDDLNETIERFLVLWQITFWGKGGKSSSKSVDLISRRHTCAVVDAITIAVAIEWSPLIGHAPPLPFFARSMIAFLSTHISFLVRLQLLTGDFCPTPQKSIFQGLERAVLGDWDLRQCLNARWHVNGFRPPGELVASTQINVTARQSATPA